MVGDRIGIQDEVLHKVVRIDPSEDDLTLSEYDDLPDPFVSELETSETTSEAAFQHSKAFWLEKIELNGPGVHTVAAAGAKDEGADHLQLQQQLSMSEGETLPDMEEVNVQVNCELSIALLKTVKIEPISSMIMAL